MDYATSREGADKVAADITKAGGKAIAVGASVAKEADIEVLFAETKQAFGKVDILANNAGVYGFAPLEQVVDTITKSLAKELAPRKIRLNTINPGLVTPEGRHSAGLIDSDFEKESIEDIAPPVAFLASDDARWITEETIFVSGGAAI